MLILGSIVFLKVLTLALQALACERSAGSEPAVGDVAGGAVSGAAQARLPSPTSLRLRIDPRIVCYSSSEHQALAGFSFPLIVVYGVGFPIVCVWVLRHAFGPTYRAVLPDSRALPASVVARGRAYPDHWASVRADYLGFLYRGLVHSHWYFRLFTFVTNWAFALQNVFANDSLIRVFVPGVFFLINAVGTAALWPFSTWLSNLTQVVIGFGGVLQAAIFLGLIGAKTGRDDTPTSTAADADADGGTASDADAPSATNPAWSFLYWLLALSLISAGIILYVRWYKPRALRAERSAVRRRKRTLEKQLLVNH